MATSTPLQRVDLVDCVKANAKQGVVAVATQCGYGDDLEGFKQELTTTLFGACCHPLSTDSLETILCLWSD